MLRIGLSGGIGAGKSTVSATFEDAGAVLIDSDVISREVVAAGTPGLRSLVDEFGRDVLAGDGSLDRPALAAIAFADDDRRAALNGIVHPLVAERRAEILRATDPDAVVVEDIPLLVENGLAPFFPLVVMVHADDGMRVRRLVEYRGFTEDDARARIAAQATEEARRAVADVWLDNSGDAGDLRSAARALWHGRILPFSANLTAGRAAATDPVAVPADPSWPEQAARIVARLRAACGHLARRVDHVGPTAVAGLDAVDVIDVQVTVASYAAADELREALRSAGYPRLDRGDGDGWSHASADPGRPTTVGLRVEGSPEQRFALAIADRLREDDEARAKYLARLRDAPGDADRWPADLHERALGRADDSER